MPIKRGARILALDDAPFSRRSVNSLVVGVLGRQGILEGVLSFKVRVSGNDSTSKIALAIKKSRFRDQVRILALNGGTFAGLNLIDMKKLRKEFKLPILAITRKRPRNEMLLRALEASGAGKKKIMLAKENFRACTLYSMHGYYIQSMGMERQDVKALSLEAAGLLRLAHIIASGIANGESKGRV